MMTRMNKGILFFTAPILLLTIIASGAGLMYPDMYARETADWSVQTIGQDAANLFVIVPVLLFSALRAAKGSRAAAIVWFGALITNIYSYAIYAFALHFNFLFHVYCAILGLSVYAALYFLKEQHDRLNNDKRVVEASVAMTAAGYLLIVLALLFSALWLADSLPAALLNKVPESIARAGLLTNPVHVLDFSFYLPLMILSGVWLIRKQPAGYFFGPALLTFTILMIINMISLMIMSLWFSKASGVWPVIAVLSCAVLLCLACLMVMLRRLKTGADGH